MESAEPQSIQQTWLNGGAGFRFMLVEKQKLSIGIDVAYAEDAKLSVYFQVGD